MSGTYDGGGESLTRSSRFSFVPRGNRFNRFNSQSPVAVNRETISRPSPKTRHSTWALLTPDASNCSVMHLPSFAIRVALASAFTPFSAGVKHPVAGTIINRWLRCVSQTVHSCFFSSIVTCRCVPRNPVGYGDAVDGVGASSAMP